jgi:hypothetical protein
MYETRRDFAFDTVIHIHKDSKQALFQEIYNRESFGSNLGRGTCYPNWDFQLFPSVPPWKFQYNAVPQLGHDHLRQIHHRLIIRHHFVSINWPTKRKLPQNVFMYFSPFQATCPSLQQDGYRYVTMLPLLWQGERGSNRHWRQGRHVADAEAMLLLRPQEWLLLHRLSLCCEQYLRTTSSL